MARLMYKVYGPDAFVLGQAMLALFQASNYPHVATILQAREITYIEPETWYPQQLWLDIFNDLVAISDEPAVDLAEIGMTLIETAVFLPSFWEMPFIEILRFFGTIYEAVNNRGQDIGSIHIKELSANHVIMHNATPYPDDFVLGAYFATARRYFLDSPGFIVYYDPSILRRDEDGTETLVHIEWSNPYFRF